MTRRGAARRMQSAIADKPSWRTSSRSAAAGISAISRAMAVEATCSAAVMLTFRGRFANGLPQIAVVLAQEVGCIRGLEPEAEKDGNLHVAICLFDEARC